MSTRKPEDDRIALLQGTLDLLIMRTLLFGKEHGQGIARAIQSMSGDELLVDHGSLYPHCSAWRTEAGSRRSGAPAVTIARRDSINSRRLGGNN